MSVPPDPDVGGSAAGDPLGPDQGLEGTEGRDPFDALLGIGTACGVGLVAGAVALLGWGGVFSSQPGDGAPVAAKYPLEAMAIDPGAQNAVPPAPAPSSPAPAAPAPTPRVAAAPQPDNDRPARGDRRADRRNDGGGGNRAGRGPAAAVTDAVDAVVQQVGDAVTPASEPTPTDPAPTDPAPTDPAPTDPAPTDPAPTDPAATSSSPPPEETTAPTDPVA